MPALQNPRHEAFAQAILAGLAATSRIEQSASYAYRKAGYLAKEGNSAEASASRLLRRVKPICERISELQYQAARRKKITVESIVDELEEAREVATKTEQASAMVQASNSKAKILGLIIDKTELGRAGDFSQSQSLSEIADKLLLEHGADQVSEDMRRACVGELERHARALAAIARGVVALPSPA